MNRQAIYNFVDRGELPAVRIGKRRVRVRRSALDEFIAAGETADGTPQTSETEDAEPEPAPAVSPAVGARERLASALAQSAAALAGDDQIELARALDGLVVAAREFADELRADNGS